MAADNKSSFHPLLAIIKRFYFLPGDILLSSILILLAAIADLVMPWLVKVVIDIISSVRTSFAVGNAYRKTLWICGAILLVCLIQYIVSAMLNRLYNRVVYRGTMRLRDQLYTQLQAQSVNFWAERRVGEILAHLVTDIHNLQDSSLDLASEMPFDVCTLLGLAVAMFFLNPVLALAIVGFLAVSVVFAFRIGHRGWKLQENAMSRTDDLASHIQEGLSSVRTIAAFGAAQGEKQRVQEASHRYTKNMEMAGNVQAVVTPFFGFAEYAGIVLVLVIGGWSMMHGSLTAGGLVAFLAYMELSADPIMRFSRVIPRLQKAGVSASRIHALLEETPVPRDKPNAFAPSNIQGVFNVDQLRHRYPKSTHESLQGLNFKTAAGEKVAVIGRNGSGKSTFMDIILRLQTPTQGRILVDGTDLQDFSLDRWRSFIGVLPQEIMLLNRTVAENIALGSSSMCSVREAASTAALESLIARLPQGYDTVVGERGAFLSGGEKQKIAVARLFFRNPRIVLLDEPTSALDARTEEELLPVLQNLCMGRTTFIVSHRLTVLRNADKVLLLDEGRQLAFDTPAHLWNGFPEFRGLFPDSWGS